MFMLRRRFPWYAQLSILLLLAAVSLVGWLFAPTRAQVLLAMDPLYQRSSMSFLRRMDMRYRLAAKRYTLVILKLDLATISDAQTLAATLALSVGSKTELLVTTPLVSQGLQEIGMLPTQEKQELRIVGMGTATSAVFDHKLVRNRPDEGWASAAERVLQALQGNPLPTAVLFEATDSQAVSDADLFLSRFSASGVRMVPVTSQSEMQARATMEQLDAENVMMVVVPYVRNLDRYVGSPSAEGMRWVVDDAYAELIGDGSLEGTVTDDLFLSVLPLLGNEHPPVSHELPLVRTYRRAGRN